MSWRAWHLRGVSCPFHAHFMGAMPAALRPAHHGDGDGAAIAACDGGGGNRDRDDKATLTRVGGCVVERHGGWRGAACWNAERIAHTIGRVDGVGRARSARGSE